MMAKSARARFLERHLGANHTDRWWEDSLELACFEMAQ